MGITRVSSDPCLAVYWSSSRAVWDAISEHWGSFWLWKGGLCISSAIRALVHGAQVGTHGLEAVIYSMFYYQMTPRYILMHDLLSVFERPVCFWHLLYGVLGWALGHLHPAAVAVKGANLPAYVFEIFHPLTWKTLCLWVGFHCAMTWKEARMTFNVSVLPLYKSSLVDCILQAWSSFRPKYQAGGKRTVSHSLHPPHKYAC